MPLSIPVLGSWKGAKYFLSPSWAEIPLCLGLVGVENPSISGTPGRQVTQRDDNNIESTTPQSADSVF